MTTSKSKKLVPFYIYEILKKYTDENNCLSQKEIEDKLKSELGVSVERKSIRRYIQDLIEIGINVCYTEKNRKVKNITTGEFEEQSMMTDIYLERELCDSELRLLIDELRDSEFIPTGHKKKLISKLESMSGPDFHKGRASVGTMNDNPVTNELFYTLSVIEEATSEGRKVSFKYKRFVYGAEGVIECRLEDYTVIPFDTKIFDGNYYLICSEDGDSEIYLRMDLITGINFSKEYAARASHIRLRSTVVFETDENMVSAFVEQFGNENVRVDDFGDALRLSVLTDEAYAESFALKYSADVTVIAPESCRRKVSEILRAGWERYGGCAS